MPAPAKLFASILIIFFLIGPSSAQEPGKQPTASYVITPGIMFKTNDNVLIIGGVVLKNVSEVKDYVSTLSPGSTLQWTPSCFPSMGQPLATEAEINDLKQFCEKRGVKFIVIPAG